MRFIGQLVAIELVVAAGCRTVAPTPPAPPHAEVRVTPSACIAQREAEAAIDRVLVEHHAEHSGLVVAISGSPEEGSTDVALRVTAGNGDVGLERSYHLAENDCASAPQLLALAVDRWLTSFPQWAEPPLPPPPQPARWPEIAASAAIDAVAPPFGIDGELGALADVGGPVERFGGSVLVRTGWPQSAGSGRFRETAVLAGAMWRHRFARVETRVELRAGALRVNGIGFLRDDSSWLPWWEAAAFVGWRWPWGSLGGELAASATRDHAVTRDGLVSQDIPFVRLGISGSFGLYGP